MNIHTFISNYREAFGQDAELPIAFWYSDCQEANTEKINGCFFKCMKSVRKGQKASLDNVNIGCGGGKFYTGFTCMPQHVPDFVAFKEKYKQTPEMVLDYVNELGVPSATKAFLHFARIDRIRSFDDVEGLLFLATPDQLSGLATWAYFDNNAEDAVSAPFGSGCCSVVTQAVLENRNQGRRTFVGFFDPSVRPHFESDLLSFTIPMHRFREMCDTMRDSCLFDTHAWGKIQERMQAKQESSTPARKPDLFCLNPLPGIRICEVTVEDAEAIYRAIDTHRNYLRTWLPFVDNMRSVADEAAFLKSVCNVPAEQYQPVFALRNDQDEVCGLIGFHFTDFANRRTEIGYWLLPQYQHRGIMSICVRHLCKWAMEEWGMKRIQIRCAVGNEASIGIPRRVGFRQEGTERAGELLASGKYVDVVVYSFIQGVDKIRY